MPTTILSQIENIRLLRTATATLALLLLAACTTTTPPFEPRNLTLAKREVVAYVESGRYGREIAVVAVSARDFIAQRTASRATGERLAVVLDIDETALTNLPHIRAFDFGYVPDDWNAWVARGEAPALVPVLEIFRAARSSSVDVFFITGRRERDRPGTEKNLRETGYGDHARLVCKPDDSRESTGIFKTATRKALVAEGYVIIANIGDQPTDLSGGFAERVFKLPNPFYLVE